MVTRYLKVDSNSLTRIVEAVLFSAREALSARQIATILDIKEAKKIRPIIKDLNEFYEKHHRAFSIRKVAGGYQLRTDPELQKWIRKGRVVRPIRFSPAVLETISIIAYQQPITRAEIESIRSVDATYALRSLLEKKLIRIVGRKEVPGRPLLYGTSRFFLEIFGFNSIKELPRLEEFDILQNSDIEVGPEVIEAD